MFDKPWSEVTEEDIENLGNRLADELGGWIFHEKVDFSYKIPHIQISRSHPKEFSALRKV